MIAQPPSLLLTDTPPRADARRLAEDLAGRHGDCVAAILFHGSCLRDDSTGILDLYVLVDDYAAFHRNRAAALANAALPPSVQFEPSTGPANAGAKVAVISRRQFLARLGPDSLDTTLWARFCQPAVLAYCRDPEVQAWVAAALAKATATAVGWAVRLGPAQGSAGDYWTALFRHTYGAELRVEGAGRAEQIYRYAAPLFDAAFVPGDEAERLSDGRFAVTLGQDERRRAQARWLRRRRLGKGLNVLRLLKALFTFSGGVDYIVGKLERHSGQRITLTPWQRRHPILAAPAVLVSLRKRDIIR